MKSTKKVVEEEKRPIAYKAGTAEYKILSHNSKNLVVCNITLDFSTLFSQEEQRALWLQKLDARLPLEKLADIVELLDSPPARACNAWYITWACPIFYEYDQFWDPLTALLKEKYPEKDIVVVLCANISGEFRDVKGDRTDWIDSCGIEKSRVYDYTTDPHPDNIEVCETVIVIGDDKYLATINKILEQKKRTFKVIYFPADFPKSKRVVISY